MVEKIAKAFDEIEKQKKNETSSMPSTPSVNSIG
jgi:hypothetical protein